MVNVANIFYEELVVCSKPQSHLEASKFVHCNILPRWSNNIQYTIGANTGIQTSQYMHYQ